MRQSNAPDPHDEHHEISPRGHRRRRGGVKAVEVRNQRWNDAPVGINQPEAPLQESHNPKSDADIEEEEGVDDHERVPLGDRAACRAR